MPSTPRLHLVSNRLPLRIRAEASHAMLEPTVGGLATGLRRVHERSGGSWVGWPGTVPRAMDSARSDIDALLAEHRVVPVHLSHQENRRYYLGYCNGVLWPLLHGLPGHMERRQSEVSAWRAVNARFAEAVVGAHAPGDDIWVHDFHLARVPDLLRSRLGQARIGFFLHVPFPPTDVLRLLHAHEDFVRGMLGADLIGFQTFNDQRNFLLATTRMLGLPVDGSHVVTGDRIVRTQVLPIGPDVGVSTSGEAADDHFRSDVERATRAGVLLLGVDRLDYTKGIPQRLEAFERLLEQHPRWRGKARFVQVAAPSREEVSAYRELRREVDEIVGRINGAWATLSWTPVTVLHRAVGPADVRALYRSAGVMVVTPVRDGMNLVAKEFVAAREDGDGVLVLSEFAGAADELPEALRVHPLDIDGMAGAMHEALRMPRPERATRMSAMRRRVLRADIHAWTARFLAELRTATTEPQLRAPDALTEDDVRSWAKATYLILLLDYDGTLAPFHVDPARARPDDELRALLRALCELPMTEVHIVSGRARHTLADWFPDRRLRLHGDHGASERTSAGTWVTTAHLSDAHRALARDVMAAYADRIDGSFVEDKPLGVAWHYRAVGASGRAAARELLHHLSVVLARTSVTVQEGDMVIEVRAAGADKGAAVRRARAAAPADGLVVAIGDDRTDEDMFEALSPPHATILVGARATRASLRIPDVQDVRACLSALAGMRAIAIRGHE